MNNMIKVLVDDVNSRSVYETEVDGNSASALSKIMNTDYRTSCFHLYKAVISFSKNGINDYLEGTFTFAIPNLCSGGIWTSRIKNGKQIAHYLNAEFLSDKTYKIKVLSANTPSKYADLMKHTLIDYLIEKYDKDSLSGFEFAYLKLDSFIKKPQPEQISLFN